jgi:NAD(P)H-dependent flavin oxidoreductase YrpB (nitropropane dioxygenase family)
VLATRFTELLDCSVPIQQAGMGGFADPRLPAAVAGAGAVGMVGGVMVPADAIPSIFGAVSAETDGPVGVNFLIPFLDKEAVEAAAEHARLVEFFYGVPDPSLVHVAGSSGALVGWQVGSTEEARAAEAAGCDLVIAQGLEAGGHVRGETALLPLLAEVLDAVGVPVVAAGGIANARGMAAALAAGADAVRLGTRFVASAESPAHHRYVSALVAAAPEDTVLTESFSGMWPDAPHRVLRSCVAAAEEFHGDVVGEIEVAGQRLPVQRLSVPCPTGEVSGAIEAMALYAGQSVGAIDDVKPAGEIVRELSEGAEGLLRRWRD